MKEIDGHKRVVKDEEVEENVSTIIKRKNISMKPMDEEEAILQMELHKLIFIKKVSMQETKLLLKK